MTYYAITAAGLAELQAEQSNLPRRVRSLLRLLHGHQSVEELQAVLTSFGNVAIMLDALKDLGLARELEICPGAPLGEEIERVVRSREAHDIRGTPIASRRD